jgi:hypothetical protein
MSKGTATINMSGDDGDARALVNAIVDEVGKHADVWRKLVRGLKRFDRAAQRAAHGEKRSK